MAKSQEALRNEQRRDMWDSSRKIARKPRCVRRAARTDNRVRSNQLVILGADGIVRTATVYTTRRCKAVYDPNLQEILNSEGEAELARISRFWFMGYVRC